MIKFSYKDAILNKIQKTDQTSEVNIIENVKPVIKVPVVEEFKFVNKFTSIQNVGNVQHVINMLKINPECDYDDFDDVESIEESIKEESKKDESKKKNINDIFIIKDSIPPKEDILRLCSHGKYNKINLINNSYFNNENVHLCIKYMHNKINEIKKWKEEPCNNNSNSKKRFNNRIDSIYKTINLFKTKHLEYLSDSILTKPTIEIVQEVKVVPKIEPKVEIKVVPKIETKVVPKVGPKVGPKVEKVVPKVGPKVEKVVPKVGPKVEKVVPKVGPKIQNKKNIKNKKEIDDLINDGWVKVGKRG